jgi:peroxiredoxin
MSLAQYSARKTILMRILTLISLAPVLLLLSIGSGGAADATGVGAELDSLVAKIQTQLREGKTTEAEFAAELKEFDVLLARHKGEYTDALANVLVEEASLYLQVFENFDKARALIETLKRDFPQTKPAQNADKLLVSISRHAEAKRLKAIFVVGSPLPDFDEKDLDHRPLSIRQFRGKIVLLDFGATWSKAWVNEVPNVRRLYDKYHGKGFEIIGVSLDQDQLRLSGFTAQNKLPWPQVSDAAGWNNRLAVKYGINSLPDNFLLDGQGTILARNLRGQQLEDALLLALNQRAPPPTNSNTRQRPK